MIVDLGKAQGILPQSEQIQTEKYHLNQKIKVLVKDIREGGRGLEIIVSRADPEFVKCLFAQEVPEVASGVVKIEAMSREPGSRTKMAVSSRESNIDPVGSCVGQKGVRVQAIIAELSGEKIDIIPYSPEIDRFIASSLSPAKVADVISNKETKEAKILVPDDQLSLAIGKEGQNVRLAAKLTGWRIDIKGLNDTKKIEELAAEGSKEVVEEAEEETKKEVSEEAKDEGIMDKQKEEPQEETKGNDTKPAKPQE